MQPGMAGMTFLPAFREVTLPPEAAGISFTAYEAGGEADSTSMLEAPPAEKTPWQELWGTLARLSRVLQQFAILMLVLSLGAFMALAARRLRSEEWSLAHLFQPVGIPSPEAPAPPKADNGWELLEEEAQNPEMADLGVEPGFEVVTAVSAPDAARLRPAPARSAPAEPERVERSPEPPVEAEPEAAVPAAEPEPEPPAPEPEVLPGEGHPAPAPHLRVRRYTGSAPAQPQAAPQAPSPDLLRQGMELVRKGDYAGGEALLRQVIAQAPGNAEAWLWLGAARLNQGDARTAKGCFLQAKRLGHPQADAALKRT